jgi:DNA-binding transcriptional ArsR family regulator
VASTGNRFCANVKQLDDRALGFVAAYFQALSEPLRLKILNELRSGARNVNDLTARLSCSQANVSKHLGVLSRLGFVARDAQGTAAYYRIADPAVYELCDLVCGRLALQLQDHVAALKSLHGTARPQETERARGRRAGSRAARPPAT